MPGHHSGSGCLIRGVAFRPRHRCPGGAKARATGRWSLLFVVVSVPWNEAALSMAQLRLHRAKPGSGFLATYLLLTTNLPFVVRRHPSWNAQASRGLSPQQLRATLLAAAVDAFAASWHTGNFEGLMSAADQDVGHLSDWSNPSSKISSVQAGFIVAVPASDSSLARASAPSLAAVVPKVAGLHFSAAAEAKIFSIGCLTTSFPPISSTSGSTVENGLRVILSSSLFQTEASSSTSLVGELPSCWEGTKPRHSWLLPEDCFPSASGTCPGHLPAGLPALGTEGVCWGPLHSYPQRPQSGTCWQAPLTH